MYVQCKYCLVISVLLWQDGSFHQGGACIFLLLVVGRRYEHSRYVRYIHIPTLLWFTDHQRLTYITQHSEHHCFASQTQSQTAALNTKVLGGSHLVAAICLPDSQRWHGIPFDTVNPETLLQRLKIHLGVKGTPLVWFHTYVENRKQTTTVMGCHPRMNSWTCLFSGYTLPLGNIIRAYHLDVNYIFYADDREVYRFQKRLLHQLGH